MPQIVQPEAGFPDFAANPGLACKQDEGRGQIIQAHRLAESGRTAVVRTRVPGGVGGVAP